MCTLRWRGGRWQRRARPPPPRRRWCAQCPSCCSPTRAPGSPRVRTPLAHGCRRLAASLIAWGARHSWGATVSAPFHFVALGPTGSGGILVCVACSERCHCCCRARHHAVGGAAHGCGPRHRQGAQTLAAHPCAAACARPAQGESMPIISLCWYLGNETPCAACLLASGAV